MGSGIGVVATCRRGRQWSTERCFVPCSGGPLRLSLDNLGTVTLTAGMTLGGFGWCKTRPDARKRGALRLCSCLMGSDLHFGKFQRLGRLNRVAVASKVRSYAGSLR